MPEIPFVPTHSDRSTRIDLILGGDQIDMYRYIQSFEFELGSSTKWGGNITMFDPDWWRLEELAIRAKALQGQESGMQFRFGWHDLMSEWYEVNLLSYTPTYTAQGVGIALNFCAPSIIKGNAEIYSGSWPAGTTPSAIVEQLAPLIDPVYRDSNRRLIESSKPYPREIIMMKKHPLNWIQEQFCGTDPDKATLSAVREGMGGYECVEAQDADGQKVFHFHSSGYDSKLVRSYVFARGQMGQVISFSLSDMSSFCQLGGAGKSEGTIANANEKFHAKYAASATGEKGTEAIPLYEQHIRTPPDPTNPAKKTKFFVKPFVDEELLRQHMVAVYQMLQSANYNADMEILGDPFIRYNDFIEVTILPIIHAKSFVPPSSKHYASGYYRVTQIKHSIQSGAYTTTLTLQKGTLDLTDPGAKVAAKSAAPKILQVTEGR